MKRFIILFSLLFVTFSIAFSQEKPNIVVTKGEATVEWYQEVESKSDAKNRAEERAKINALENAFGTVVVQGNSTYIENVNTGTKTRTKTVFNMIGDTYVKGEIVDVLKNDFKEHKQVEGRGRKKTVKIFIECNVKLKAREIADAKIDIKAHTLSNNMKNFQTNTFYEGDELYIYFQSPVPGYLTAFIDNGKTSERILPYEGMGEKYINGLPVETDKEYIFFSVAEDHQYFDDFENYEIVLVPDKDLELNRVFVIFSKDPLNKPRLKEDINLTPEDVEKNYRVPKGLETKEFRKWLIRNYQTRADMQVEEIIITVQKNKE